MFSRARLPKGIRDLEALTRFRIQGLEEATTGSVAVKEKEEVRYGNIPAMRLLVQQSVDAQVIETRSLLAILPDDTYVQIIYKIRENDKDAAVRLDHVASTAFSDQQNTGPAQAGFTRRTVRSASVEVPSNLNPPSDFTFSFSNGQGSFDLTLSKAGDDSPAQPTADQDNSGSPKPLNVAGGSGEISCYNVSKDKDNAACRARVRFSSGDVATVVSRAPAALRPLMEGYVTAFVGSLREP